MSVSGSQSDFFNQETQSSHELAPWAEKLRPRSWDEFLGQDEVKARLLEIGTRSFWPSLLLYGPPGSGKTTMVGLLRSKFNGSWLNRHGAELKVSDIRALAEEGGYRRRTESRQTLIFIDEIHALTKVQQDALLEPVEKGDLVILGATTENPAFFLRPALRSRIRSLNLKAHTEEALRQLVNQVLGKLKLEIPEGPNSSEAFGTRSGRMEDELIEILVKDSRGDARRLLNDFESLMDEERRLGRALPADELRSLLRAGAKLQLSEDDYHASLSAMIKSIRGSDPDAALIWMTQLLDGGMDPRLILRRLIISASEDIGNAEPRALQVAVSAAQGFEIVGLPEGRLNIAQAVIFLACCPKSDAVYVSSGNATRLVENSFPFQVPDHLQAKGKDLYQNPHDQTRGWIKQRYLPENLKTESSVMSWTGKGQEKKLIEYLQWLRGEKIKGSDDTSTSES